MVSYWHVNGAFLLSGQAKIWLGQTYKQRVKMALKQLWNSYGKEFFKKTVWFIAAQGCTRSLACLSIQVTVLKHRWWFKVSRYIATEVMYTF